MDRAGQLLGGDGDPAILRLLHDELAIHDLFHRLRRQPELVGEIAGERVARLLSEELVELPVLAFPVRGGDHLSVHLRRVGGRAPAAATLG
jgi:hypothetical protein